MRDRIACLSVLLGPFMEDGARLEPLTLELLRRAEPADERGSAGASAIAPRGVRDATLESGHEPHLVAHITNHFMHFADFAPPRVRCRNPLVSTEFGPIRDPRAFV